MNVSKTLGVYLWEVYFVNIINSNLFSPRNHILLYCLQSPSSAAFSECDEEAVKGEGRKGKADSTEMPVALHL